MGKIQRGTGASFFFVIFFFNMQWIQTSYLINRYLRFKWNKIEKQHKYSDVFHSVKRISLQPVFIFETSARCDYSYIVNYIDIFKHILLWYYNDNSAQVMSR